MQRSESAIGKIIDGYKILKVLGQGGMGIVYKAEDVALARQVALKMINPELASQDMFLRRFQLEAKALARVDSPYIVGVHALRKAGEHVFIVMEFVDGWTLSDEMDNGTLDSKRAYSILKQLLNAFSHAHGVGVIHRDIKPSNIMISRSGRVKVTDFGLAKLRREDGMTTMTQGIAGTARYMSPEQVLGKKIDHRSDIYSLGMTLYHLFAGELPFGSEEGTYSILKRVVEEEFREVTSINEKIPKPISKVISKAIAKDPDDRYQTADEMLDALEEAFGIRQQSASGQTTAPVEPKPYAAKEERPAKKQNILVYAAIALCLILIYPVYSFVSNLGADEPPITQQPPSNPGGQDPPATGLPGENQEDPGATSTPEAQFAFPAITSTPSGAIVMVGGQTLGNTPVRSRRVEAGAVEITVQMEGYITQRRTVTLEPGTTPSLQFDLQRQQSSIAQQPVEVPQETETGPVNGSDNPPQTNSNPVVENPVEQPPVEEMATLHLFAEPAGQIYVNNTPFRNESVQDWAAGTYSVRIVDPTDPEVACEATINIAPGTLTSRTCYFMHSLTVVTMSEGGGLGAYANLKINGEDAGTTPLAGHPVKSGSYEIELSRFGFEIERPTRTIELKPSFDQNAMVHKESFLIKSQ